MKWNQRAGLQVKMHDSDIEKTRTETVKKKRDLTSEEIDLEHDTDVVLDE